MFGIILLKDDIDCLITVETVCTAGNVSLTLKSNRFLQILLSKRRLSHRHRLHASPRVNA